MSGSSRSLSPHSVCAAMGLFLSEHPWFRSGSWTCENAVYPHWQGLPKSFSFRMSLGFPSTPNEEQTTGVCHACCFSSSSQWIFFMLVVRMMDLHLAASTWDAPRLGVEPAGLSGRYLCLLTFHPGPPCHWFICSGVRMFNHTSLACGRDWNN